MSEWKPYISTSEIKDFLRCNHLWWLQRVEGVKLIDPPLPEQGRGFLFHLIVFGVVGTAISVVLGAVHPLAGLVSMLIVAGIAMWTMILSVIAPVSTPKQTASHVSYAPIYYVDDLYLSCESSVYVIENDSVVPIKEFDYPEPDNINPEIMLVTGMIIAYRNNGHETCKSAIMTFGDVALKVSLTEGNEQALRRTLDKMTDAMYGQYYGRDHECVSICRRCPAESFCDETLTEKDDILKRR